MFGNNPRAVEGGGGGGGVKKKTECGCPSGGGIKNGHIGYGGTQKEKDGEKKDYFDVCGPYLCVVYQSQHYFGMHWLLRGLSMPL